MKKDTNNLLPVLLISAIFMGAISSTVFAQKQKRHHQINQQTVLDQLALSEEVRHSLKMIMTQQKEWMNTLRRKSEEQRYQTHQERKRLHEIHKEQIQAILTVEQLEAFEKAMWSQRHKGHKRKMMHLAPKR